MPQVSVVIPTYNRAEFLRSAIRSVLGQTYQDFEIIVVDDGSPENIQKIVREFGDQRIKYIGHEMNRGEALSRNTGIANSNGTYVAFLDDDDEWLPEKLELQTAVFEKGPSKVGLVYSGYFGVKRDPNGEGKVVYQTYPEEREDVSGEIMIKNFIGAPSVVLLRREVIERVGLFDPDIAYGLDYDYWIRIAKHFHFDYVKEPLVRYHLHENRLSRNLEIMAKGIRDMRRKYGRSFILRNTYYRNRYLVLGTKFCSQGDTKNGRKAFLGSISLNPFDLRSYVHLGLSLFGARTYLRLRALGQKFLDGSSLGT